MLSFEFQPPTGGLRLGTWGLPTLPPKERPQITQIDPDVPSWAASLRLTGRPERPTYSRFQRGGEVARRRREVFKICSHGEVPAVVLRPGVFVSLCLCVFVFATWVGSSIWVNPGDLWASRDGPEWVGGSFSARGPNVLIDRGRAGGLCAFAALRFVGWVGGYLRYLRDLWAMCIGWVGALRLCVQFNRR